jgi:Holliday junction resolvase RusA-like endonuclease
MFESPPDDAFALRLDCMPRAKGRGRASRSGRRCPACRLGVGSIMIRTPEETRRLERQIKLAAQVACRLNGFELLDGPLYARVVGIWPRIQRMPDRKHAGRQWRPARPDWDNVAKLVLDALSGVVYGDDAQIVHGQALTVYAADDEPAGIEVAVWRAPVFP